LLLNDISASKKNWYFEAKENLFLASGSLNVDLNSTNGTGNFTIELKGSFHDSGTNNNSITKQTINIDGGWSILENCELNFQETKDNGNNTAQIVFTLPSNNLSNIVQGAKLLWTTNNTIPTEGTAYTFTKIYQGTELSSIIDTISFDKNCKYIYFELIPIGSKDALTASPLLVLASNIEVKYYASPYFNMPIDDELEYKNQQPTTRENLCWRWSAANAFNINSPVQGYVLDIYKNNEPIQNINPDVSSNFWNFIAEEYPLSFERKDDIYLGIRAYALNGQGDRLYSDTVYTHDYIFGNNGIMRAKIDGDWEIGQVWLKDNNEWKIAAALFVKDTDNQWHIAI
jgi:hypothetical protein